MRKGFFITFEGPEGSGKSTQSRRLKRFLSSKKIPVLLTREPGGTFVGEFIRDILLTPTKRMFSSRAELFLYLADRSQHVDEKISPFLKRGGVVISDRFTDATIAYQGFGRTLDTVNLIKLNQIATDGLEPNITFLLDVPPEKGLVAARKTSAKKMKYELGDRLEQEDIKFHTSVREGYLALARDNPERIRIINGIGSRDDIFQKILKELSPLLRTFLR